MTRPPLARFTARLRSSFRGRRGSAQLGLLLASAAVAGGMTLGSGVASHNAKSGYDLAWLTDSKTGQLVQVDPALGRANVRLQVASPGDSLVIQQSDGHLVVIDRKTGKITSIDIGTLLVGGSRDSRPGTATKVVLAGDRLYVADLAAGIVQAVDPATQADVGTPWSAGRPLVDIGVDGANAVWALDNATNLANLRWDTVRNTLIPVSTRSVAGAGPGSVIVAHQRGVTIVGSKGTIVRVGTSHDGRLDAPQEIRGPLQGPLSSPDGLVPVASPGSSTVVIIGQSGAVVDDVSTFGCDRPGTPTVFDDKVYVPCLGAQRVLVLDKDGHQVGAAIPTPAGGDPQLTVSGDHLVIDVPGAGKATVVDRSGDTRDFPTSNPNIGVQNPSQPLPDPPAPPTPKPPKHHDTGGKNPSDGGGGDTPDVGGGQPSGNPSGNPSGGPSGSNPQLSTAATATARPDGSVVVTWEGVDADASTTVTDTTSGSVVATVPAGGTSAMVTVLTPGTTTSFAVHNAKVDATTNAVTTSTPPGTVTGVAVTGDPPRGTGRSTLQVTWTAAAPNGAAPTYTVSAPGTQSVMTTDVHASLSVPCAGGCSGTVTVTPANSAGAGAKGTAPYTVTVTGPSTPPTKPPTTPPTNPPTTPPTTPPPPAQVLPAPGQNLITTTVSPGNDNTGVAAEAHLTINATADWRAFTGTCSLTEDGYDAGSVACDASGLTRTFDYYETGTHTYTVVAHGTSGTAASAAATAHVIYRNLCTNSASERSLTGGGVLSRPVDCNPTCPGCSIPFLDPQGAGNAAAVPATRPSRFVAIALGALRWDL